MALALSRRRKVVAVFLDTVKSVDRDCLRGIAGYADGRAEWDFYVEERVVREVRELPLKHIDGVIVRLSNAELLEAIRKAGVSVVNLSARRRIVRIPLVCNDNGTIGRVAADYFLTRGYKHVAAVGDLDHEGISMRMEGLMGSAEERGAEVRSYDIQSDFCGELAKWAREVPMPVGVFSGSEAGARRILHHCRENGIHVPEKIAVLAAVSDELVCSFHNPQLSSITCNGYRIGYAAAAMLAKQMAGLPVEAITRIPPTGVVTRRSSDMLAVSNANVLEALRFIRSSHHLPITCDEVAEHAALPRRTLDRSFRQQLGRSVTQEIRRVRIETAQRLLVNTEEPLGRIAESCGFDYPERFSVVFKRMVGTTPSSFRKRYR